MVPAEAVQKRIDGFVEMCRMRGIKVTHQRIEVLRELAATGEHPDAETLFERVRKRIPAISLDTVYRTLHMFEDMGVISRVGAVCDRARFDANTERHHHFVCSNCGKIDDFTSADLDRFAAPPEAVAMGRVDSVHVEVRGLCRDCQKEEEKETGRCDSGTGK